MSGTKLVFFERAIFLSWYCSKGDCSFCYMSTQKGLIRNPALARRSKESILAEAFLCKLFGWEIGFLSGGYESYSFDELVSLVRDVCLVYGRKLWLNVGVLSKAELNAMRLYLEGICGAVECINPRIHKRVCPSKPIAAIEGMLDDCDELGLKKSVTIIIGLGETMADFDLLKKFIKKHRLDKITFYALNPHPGTPFTKGPETQYYVEWIRRTRQEFPKLKIVAGSWVDRLPEIHLLLEAGADNITKFPAIKLFGSIYAKQIEEEVRKAGRKFISTLTRIPNFDVDEELSRTNLEKPLREKVSFKIKQYLSRIKATRNAEHQLV